MFLCLHKVMGRWSERGEDHGDRGMLNVHQMKQDRLSPLTVQWCRNGFRKRAGDGEDVITALLLSLFL